jgi:hypothetical protein
MNVPQGDGQRIRAQGVGVKEAGDEQPEGQGAKDLAHLADQEKEGILRNAPLSDHRLHDSLPERHRKK